MISLSRWTVVLAPAFTASSLFAADISSLNVAVTSDWNTGHNGEITFTNTGNQPIEGWTLSYADGSALNQAWNCQWTMENGRHIISNLSWNETVLPGATISVGFGADGPFQTSFSDALFNGEPVGLLYDGEEGDDGNDDDGNNDDGNNDDGNDDDGNNDDGNDDDGNDDDGNNDDGNDDGNDDDGSSENENSNCPGDADGNGTVDVNDILLVINDWGFCSSCPGDIDGNGSVDVNDMLVVLGAWGDCPVIEPGDKKIVAYYIEWGIYGRDYQPADMPLDQITHINYAFANISEDGRIAIGDPYAAIEKSYPGDTWDQPYRGTYNQLNNVLRAEYPHIKTLISVGGWTWSGRFSDVAVNESSRQNFASSCVDFIRMYNFDGVDIDWEYPVCCGLGSNVYRPEDRENYTLLMGELRTQLDAAAQEDGRDYLLTIASAGGVDKLENYELAEIAAELDWVNTMSYDFMGAWDLSLTGHHSALYPNPDNPSPNPNVRDYYTSDGSVQPWLEAGVPPEKIVMGVPFYGRAWGGVDPTNSGLFQQAGLVPPGTWDDWSSGATGINDYTEIAEMIESGGYVRMWDDVSKVPWAWNPDAHGGHFISYDDPESMQYKMDYINDLGLGGAMFWEVTADREGELLDVIHQSLTD